MLRILFSFIVCEIHLYPLKQRYIKAQLLQSGTHSYCKTGEIVRGACEGALLFVMEPGLDVLGVNSLKICKGTLLFGMWRICKKM